MPRLLRIALPAILLLAALAALLVGLAFGGGADPSLIESLDPGPVVRYGLPISTLLVNLAGAGALGSLLLACFALDATRTEYNQALDIAAASAAVWTVAAGTTGFFTFLTVYSQPVRFDEAFGDTLASFLTTTEIGQAWLTTTLVAAGVTALCFAVRNQTLVAFVTALAAYGMLPPTLQGHRGGTANHDAASTALFLHVLFAAAWLGGLLTLVLVRGALEKGRLAVILRRYSTVALVCFVVVAVSGYVSALIRVETIENLWSPYGALVIVKVLALLALGAFGAVQRRFVIRRIEKPGTSERPWFWALVAGELAFMGVASGAAAALARTATPVPEVPTSELTDPSPAEILTGRPLPPPPSFENYLTMWNLDILWLLICGFGILFYIWGVIRLHRRGDRWPWYRTVLWVLGMLVLLWVTNGGVNVYEKFLFSSHMLAHMTLGMMVPVLLVPGAPITLALRAIHKRDDGSRGIREWLLILVHSKPFAILANPIVAAAIFTASLWVFYYTPVFSWATTNHVGHEWMIVHFLLSGYLFVQSLIGIDPSPQRLPYPVRLVILLATMAFHAFFGLAIMSGTGLLLADWYGAMGWDTGVTAIEDQQAGGGIAWSVGEIPNAIIALTIVFLWSRSDERETKRRDRQADRDGDAELEEYNRMLAERAKSGRPV
ncbi:cytochrome c oxidase assembly protein [Salinibacterium soli]|uniref:Cytochrome c oxidase assembly protein n=1 Tax=Antiquaquibacter soli TaxID=3064523 RepID=A0ABT9BQ11_9MICO|nr:cytochrome c oxidase assembly protein [Protaetiibacter sp. WY-16]MDO7883108.1 cytochrome c oxidase assembly protein [Protaetiibacter sp. WY-16]